MSLADIKNRLYSAEAKAGKTVYKKPQESGLISKSHIRMLRFI